MTRNKRLLLVIIVFLCAAGLHLHSQETPPSTDEPEIPPPLTHYMGREIANTMHYSGAEWLVRNTREREESALQMREALNVKPGQVLCDLGSGNGYHTIPLAKMTGENGKVYAVDIQPEMLEMLDERLKEEGVKNVVPVLGGIVDPRVPENAIDLLLLVDVYHEFSHPEQMLKAIRASLKPGGRVALVEYREEDPDVPIRPLHKMSKKQIMKEWTANGFKLVEEYDELPWQHLMFFSREE